MKTLTLLLAGLPTLACAQTAPPSLVSALTALPSAATDRRHYWADVELGRCTLGSLALGTDLPDEMPRHRLLTASIHDKASTFQFDSHSEQQYEPVAYQALGGSLAAYARGVGIDTIAPVLWAALKPKATDKGLLTPRLAGVPQGLLMYQTVYQTDCTASSGPQTGFWHYGGSGGWVLLSASGGGGGLTLPYSGAASVEGAAFAITNTSGVGVYGSSGGNATGVPGVLGTSSASGGVGVLGQASSGSNGVGVLGITSTGYGVRGEASGSNGSAVFGKATNGAFAGLYGQASGSAANGLVGEAAGMGRAGYFTKAFGTGSANALEVQNASTGSAALLSQSNSNSPANALEVQNAGKGSAAFFNQRNSSSSSPAVTIQQSGSGPALSVSAAKGTPAVATPSTGLSHNLLPVAYGTVGPTGGAVGEPSAYIRAGSDNFMVTSSYTGQLIIQFTSPDLIKADLTSAVVIATTRNAQGFVSVSTATGPGGGSIPGTLVLNCFVTTNTQPQLRFAPPSIYSNETLCSFVVYLP